MVQSICTGRLISWNEFSTNLSFLHIISFETIVSNTVLCLVITPFLFSVYIQELLEDQKLRRFLMRNIIEKNAYTPVSVFSGAVEALCGRLWDQVVAECERKFASWNTFYVQYFFQRIFYFILNHIMPFCGFEWSVLWGTNAFLEVDLVCCYLQ